MSPSLVQTPTFPRDLDVDYMGLDVRVLQTFLNTHGFPVASSGMGSPGEETDYFGERTRLALAAFQETHHISPAAGYFGPKTRSAIESMNIGASASKSTDVSTSTTAVFRRQIVLGDTGDDVLALQKFLNSHGFPVAASGMGSPGQETAYFGTRTMLALAAFQEAHADIILTPQGFGRGTGMLGPASRLLINELRSKGQ